MAFRKAGFEQREKAKIHCLARLGGDSSSKSLCGALSGLGHKKSRESSLQYSLILSYR